MKLPSRDEVRQALEDLVAGRRSRDEVEDWAMPWVVGEADVTDMAVWRTLNKLCQADARDTPGVYLYHAVDFQFWLEEYERDVTRWAEE
ncbi:hypothetical protein SAMN05421678_118139 [Actinopolymorpha cephalotaxi]|uniref:Uncharacterized protein n=1 Tax=Actinopolymorpha cephalotaxi TaxID=504797 RepID=A0A1I3ACT3_9ACTN|nr:hypothetical protein [Actinopolymorpha cephalotaxi]NYH85245.1 hypothetical protein [Actinopolymorpha cephalotaxi]SFH47101.1 hypothetical protein SAMN05421678_118139 [Actinopolymorpha cephalotaxi]